MLDISHSASADLRQLTVMSWTRFIFAMQTEKLAIDLSTSARKVLAKLLDEALRSYGSVAAPKFRSDNYEMVEVLDELESRGLIRKESNRYALKSAALPLIESDAGRQLVLDIEQIYGVLRKCYRLTQEESIPVSQVALQAKVAVVDCTAALLLMLDNPLWCNGRSTDLAAPDAYLIPSEGLLKYTTFKDAENEVRSWNKPSLPAGWPTILTPESAEPQVPTQQPLKTHRFSVLAAWPAVRACLKDFSFNDIKEVAGLAGLDVTAVAHLIQRHQGGASKGELMSAIDDACGKQTVEARTRFLTILIEEILRRRPDSEERLSGYLSRLGWSFVSQTLVPLHLMDPADLIDVPDESYGDLLKAVGRFRDGDFSGAISGACGAVDSATALVYLQERLGDPAKASFQERCKKAVLARGVLVELEAQLQALGWPQSDVVPFRRNLEGALNQGAYVLQTLRSHMGDVHGSKPILRSLVFDCLRWAELIVGSLVDRRDSQQNNS